MKTLKYFLFSILLGIGFSNCSDPCDDVICANGSCDEGICNCSPGYDGTLCDNEIRAKYFGIYSGDISSCIPDLGMGMDLGELGAFTVVNLVAGPGPQVEQVNLSTTSALVAFNENVSVISDFFTIPETVTTIDDPALPIVLDIKSSGLGQFVDENTISMDLIIAIEIALIPIPITQNCTILFTK